MVGITNNNNMLRYRNDLPGVSGSTVLMGFTFYFPGK